MCGIAGYIGKVALPAERIGSSLTLMQSRGPDWQDSVSFADRGVYVSLLSSRLGIIDLDPRANQPFVRKGCTLVYNGEIYNHVELRDELIGDTAFETSSDTEVVLCSYLANGEECVERFEGMWSFALYDKNRGSLFLSRDRFGEKPLYLYQTREGTYFGSEVKYIAALSGERLEVNTDQLLRYLVNGYKSLYKGEETYFRNLTELPAAHSMEITPSGKKKIWRYWRPRIKPQSMSLQDAVQGTRERLTESLRIRLRADVPLAFCLSGGVDSSALVALAAKELKCDIATYSLIDQDPRYNEYENIKCTVDDLGCKNNLINVVPERSLDRLRELVRYHDAPVATLSYFIHSWISESLSRDGYKVAISGTSADELFTGYYDHFLLHLAEIRNKPQYEKCLRDWEIHIKKFIRNPHLSDAELYVLNPDFRDHIYLNQKELSQHLLVPFSEPFTETKYCDSLLRNRMLNELFHEATPVILHEEDLNSMKYSVENRSPYLDTQLFEFAYSIPTEYLIQDGFGKYVLREALKGVLNDKVRLDRQKKGFNASILSVIDFKACEVREELLSESPIFDIVDREKVMKWFDKEEIPNSYSKFLFQFINAKLFLEEFS